MKFSLNTAPSTRSIYLFTIVASLALSTWGAYVQSIPNPDAMLYLRAAELFSDGQWQAGLSVYRWPLYSILVASIKTVTGSTALVAAHTLDALLDCVTAVIFIALIQLLAPTPSRQRLVFWAAVIILLHPRLTTLRPMVIRDHGFYTFFLLTLYLITRDHAHPRIHLKIGALGAILIAALFRIEALFLLVLAPSFYLFVRAPSFGARVLVACSALFISALLVPGYITWTSGTINLRATFEFDPNLLAGSNGLLHKMSKTIGDFAAILPPSRNAGVVAYIGTTIAITIDATLRALTIPLAVLTVLGFVPQRLLSPYATTLVSWFAGWQLPLLFIFVAFALYLDWRYAMALTLVLTIPVVFTVHEAAERAIGGTRTAKVLFASAVLAVVAAWAASAPRDQHLEHLRDAGIWADKNLPVGARILTNDGRIAYFSGRPYENLIVTPTPIGGDILHSDYAIVSLPQHNETRYLAPETEKQILTTIDGQRGRMVRIYKLR